MAERIIRLSEYERIVAVVPQRAAGPGWANSPTWVHIVDYSSGKHREECIQPDERSPALQHLYAAGEAMQSALLASVSTKKVKRKAPNDELSRPAMAGNETRRDREAGSA